MQNGRRNNREQNAIDSALRGLKDISKGIAPELHTVSDAESYLKDLFTYGMRLSKYRAQITGIKEQTVEIKYHKKESVQRIQLCHSNCKTTERQKEILSRSDIKGG